MKLSLLSRPKEPRSTRDPIGDVLAQHQAICEEQAVAAGKAAAPTHQAVVALQEEIEEIQARIVRLQLRHERERVAAGEQAARLSAAETRRNQKLEEIARAAADDNAAAESTLQAELGQLEVELNSIRSDAAQAAAKAGAFERELGAQKEGVAQLQRQIDEKSAGLHAAELLQAEARWDAAVNQLAVAGLTLLQAHRAAKATRAPQFFEDIAVPYFSRQRSVIGPYAMTYSGGAFGGSVPMFMIENLERAQAADHFGQGRPDQAAKA